MIKLELNDIISQIESRKTKKASENYFSKAVEELFDAKKNYEIVELYDKYKHFKCCEKSFEIAYSLVNNKRDNEAFKIYSAILTDQPDNPSVLNNLSNLYLRKGNIAKAFELISKAIEFAKNDETISFNYNDLLEKVNQKEREAQVYLLSVESLENENKFVLNKLAEFIDNIKEECGSTSIDVEIPMWKFKVLMKVNEEIAESLRKQWLDKNYIIDTNQKGNNRSKIYKINPYIENKLKLINSFNINDNWINSIEQLNKEYLESIGYYEIKEKLNRVNQKYKEILLRDFDELTLNYIFKNNKATIILSGSFVETLLIYYCEKKKIKNISYSIMGKIVSKKIYDSQLSDLLSYFEENRIISKQLVHLGNVTRIYRNYIHPGRELRENDKLDFSKTNICFTSIKEIVKEVI